MVSAFGRWLIDRRSVVGWSSVLRKPDPKVIQQINFTGNLDSNENATIFFIIEEAKVTILDFSQETVIAL